MAKFLPYPDLRLSGHHKKTFQQLSVGECAQLCLQVARQNIYNCSSFEHITATRDCLLMKLSCKDRELLIDNSRSFYQLKGSFCFLLGSTATKNILPKKKKKKRLYSHPTELLQSECQRTFLRFQRTVLT